MTWAIWKQVSAAAEVPEDGGAGQGLAVRRVERVGDVDLTQLVRQGVSCLVKAGVWQGFTLTQPGDVVRVTEFLVSRYEPAEVQDLYMRFIREKEERVK